MGVVSFCCCKVFFRRKARSKENARLAIDRARSDERHQLLAGWEPTTKSVPTTGLVDVFFSDGTIREIVGDHVCNWVYPYIETGYAVAWRLRKVDTEQVDE